ncbi:MAG: NUDIX domain-containing protein [Spirochaetales bacterium]|nr:NUDIX domain-containing protein [Spirochaetales bacterium]
MKFHYVVRALIQDGDYFLVAKHIKGQNTFLPGGHVEKGEQAEIALKREILEELGALVEVKSFLGALEAQWKDDEGMHAEIDLIFYVQSNLKREQDVKSQEDHLTFSWIHKEECEKFNLLPLGVRDLVQEDDSSYNAFWRSNMESM